MRLVLHRDDIGVDAGGQWWQRVIDEAEGEYLGWTRIDRPAFIRDEVNAAHAMTDPYERKAVEIPTVRLRRTVYMEVMDYEAEVLCRQGWERVTDELPPESSARERPKEGRFTRKETA